MPKVTEEYIEKKKQMIVDAAYKVCLRKPVEMVTMMDVIDEAGLSQGGIYRFYKDLDEILGDMVTRMRMDYSIIDEVEEIMNNADGKTFAVVVHQFCDFLADVMTQHLMDIQKINFDLTVLAINEPERAEKIMGRIEGRGNFEYLATVALPKLAKSSAEKKYKPKGTPEEIFGFISSAYTGIEMNCILSACYGNGKMNSKADPKKLFNTFASTIIYLFGGEE